jgi:hypothetical protein
MNAVEMSSPPAKAARCSAPGWRSPRCSPRTPRRSQQGVSTWDVDPPIHRRCLHLLSNTGPKMKANNKNTETPASTSGVEAGPSAALAIAAQPPRGEFRRLQPVASPSWHAVSYSRRASTRAPCVARAAPSAVCAIPDCGSSRTASRNSAIAVSLSPFANRKPPRLTCSGKK